MNQKQVMWICNEVLYTWQSLRTKLFNSAGEHILQRQLWSGNRRETHTVHASDQSSAGQAAAAGDSLLEKIKQLWMDEGLPK